MQLQGLSHPHIRLPLLSVKKRRKLSSDKNVGECGEHDEPRIFRCYSFPVYHGVYRCFDVSLTLVAVIRLHRRMAMPQ